MMSFLGIAGCFLLGLLSVALYWNSLHGEFAYDDHHAVLANLDILSSHLNIFSLIRNDFWGTTLCSPSSHKSWRPLTVLLFRVIYQQFGDSSFPFHATAVGLHALCTFLVFLVAERLQSLFHFPLTRVEALHARERWGRPFPFEVYHPRVVPVVAAALFAVHPVHVDAVASVVGTAEPLCAALALSSLLCFLRLPLTTSSPPVSASSASPQSGHGPGLASLVLIRSMLVVCGCVTFVGAVFAKEHAVTLPAAAFVILLWQSIAARLHRTPSPLAISSLSETLPPTVAAVSTAGLAIAPRAAETVRCPGADRAAVSDVRDGAATAVAPGAAAVTTTAAGVGVRHRHTVHTAATPALSSPGGQKLPEKLQDSTHLEPEAGNRGGRTTAYVLLALYFVLALSYLLLRRHVAGGSLVLPLSCDDHPSSCLPTSWLRALSYAREHAEYARLLLWPHRLCFDYAGAVVPLAPAADALLPAAVLYVSLCGVMVWCAYGLIRGHSRGGIKRTEKSGPRSDDDSILIVLAWKVSLGAVLFGVWFAPASNAAAVVLTTVAERVLYLPSVAFCFIAAACVEAVLALLFASLRLSTSHQKSEHHQLQLGQKHRQHRIRRQAVFAGLLLAGFSFWLVWLGYRTVSRNEDWRFEWRLFASGAEQCPGSARANYNYANYLVSTGQLQASFPHYQAAIAVEPHHAGAHSNYGVALMRAEMYEEALLLFRRALLLDATLAKARENMCELLAFLGRRTSAQNSECVSPGS